MQVEIASIEDADIRALVGVHHRQMHDGSPKGKAYALDGDGLNHESITIFAAREDGELLGIGALRALDDTSGEVKSMRTVPKALRRGVGRAILLAVIAEAQSRGYEKLCLETGRGALFDAAISLYVAEGFQPASEFAEYEASDFNQFFELKL